MKILFIGDIVGKVGRDIVIEKVAQLKTELNLDFIIANAENAAHGKGLTKKIFHQLLASGVDAITLGNHTFSKNDIYTIIEESKLVRPINLYPTHVGSGIRTFMVKDKTILVGNLCGEIFMDNITMSPFNATKQIVDTPADIKIVDFHAEATSEKIAYCYNFSEQLTAVIGTHTHVQTADERIINGCGFITDVGMCGAFESVLGRDTEEVLQRMLHNEKTHYTVSENPAMFCGLVLTIDDLTNRTIAIERIQIRPTSN